MGWQDRDYSRSDSERFGMSGMLWQLLTGSVSLGTWFGIRVRVHATLILLVVFSLLFSGGASGPGLKNALVSSAILFGIVLLHEFGHCIAARRVGGRADDILLWPLGGLAYIDTPRRPWPTFVGVAGGPLVNVLICGITGLALLALSGWRFALPLNPLLVFGSGVGLRNDESYLLVLTNPLAYYLWWIYSVSWTLLFFNLLPIFPLDGGRIFQTMMWKRMGYYDSMNIACTVGMAGAGLLGVVGLIGGNFFLVFLAVNGFMVCRQTKLTLREDSDLAWADAQLSGDMTRPRTRKAPRSSKPRVRRDDDFSWRDLNPLERLARARRKKQFERLMKDD